MRQPPVLITDAQISQDEELKRRERRYVAMMLLRAGFLVLGAVLAMMEAPLLWLWLTICGLGMVFLPWFAVILANDRPPKDKHRLKRYRDNTAPSNALPSQPSGKTIDVSMSDQSSA